MKFKQGGVIAILLSLLIASASGAVEDWRIASYDKAEALFLAFDQKEAELLKQYEPNHKYDKYGDTIPISHLPQIRGHHTNFPLDDDGPQGKNRDTSPFSGVIGRNRR